MASGWYVHAYVARFKETGLHNVIMKGAPPDYLHGNIAMEVSNDIKYVV